MIAKQRIDRGANISIRLTQARKLFARRHRSQAGIIGIEREIHGSARSREGKLAKRAARA